MLWLQNIRDRAANWFFYLDMQEYLHLPRYFKCFGKTPVEVGDLFNGTAWVVLRNAPSTDDFIPVMHHIQ